MINEHAPTTPPEETREQRQLRKLRELTGRTDFPKFDLDRFLALAPTDWTPEEGDVDEFLANLRESDVDR